MKKILEYLYRESWEGRAPSAAFAFCVCGSVGRRQACPHSDLDAFIVTESDDSRVIAEFVEASKKVDKLLKDINTQDSTLKGFLFCTAGLNPLATGKDC